MIFVDTSALVAIIAAEADAAILAGKIAEDQERICAPHVILEAAMRLATTLGLAPTAADELIMRALNEADVTIEPITEETAHIAVAAFERYGKGRGKARLNFGDCLSYACAKAHGARLLFKGSDFSQTDVAAA